MMEPIEVFVECVESHLIIHTAFSTPKRIWSPYVILYKFDTYSLKFEVFRQFTFHPSPETYNDQRLKISNANPSSKYILQYRNWRTVYGQSKIFSLLPETNSHSCSTCKTQLNQTDVFTRKDDSTTNEILEKQKQMHEKKIKELQTEIQRLDQQKQLHDAKIEELQDQIKCLQSQCSAYNDAVSTLNKNLTKKMTLCVEQEEKIKCLENIVDSKDKELETAKQLHELKIKQLEDKLGISYKQARNVLLQKDKVEKALDACEKVNSTHINTIQQLQMQIEQLNQEHETAKQQYEVKIGELLDKLEDTSNKANYASFQKDSAMKTVDACKKDNSAHVNTIHQLRVQIEQLNLKLNTKEAEHTKSIKKMEKVIQKFDNAVIAEEETVTMSIVSKTSGTTKKKKKQEKTNSPALNGNKDRPKDDSGFFTKAYNYVFGNISSSYSNSVPVSPKQLNYEIEEEDEEEAILVIPIPASYVHPCTRDSCHTVLCDMKFENHIPTKYL